MKRRGLLFTVKMSMSLVLTVAAILFFNSQSSVVNAATEPHFEDSFESGDLTTTNNGFAWTTSNNASVSTDIAHSGLNSLKFHFEGDPTVRPSAHQQFDLGLAQRDLWMEFWIYYPDGTEGLGSEYIQRYPSNGITEYRLVEINGTANNQLLMGLRSATTSSLAANNENKFNPIWSDKTTGVQWAGQGANKLDPALTDDWRGRWVHFEMYFNVSEAENDSTLNLWVDGELVMENTALNAGHNTAEELFVRGTLLGQAVGGFAEDTNVYIDDFKVYASDPEWVTEEPAEQAPVAAFSVQPDSAVETGDVLSFLDSSTDSDGQVAEWDWNFGDGTVSTIQNPSHAFATAGEYTVTLQVTDNDGLTSTPATKVITVSSTVEDGDEAGEGGDDTDGGGDDTGDDGEGGVVEDVLFSDSFESGDATHNVNGYGWVEARTMGSTGINVEISEDIAHTGDYSMRFKMVEKPRGCGSTPGCDNTAEQRFNFGENQNEVWLSWYQYYPDGTEGLGPRWNHRTDVGANNNKFLVIGPSWEYWEPGNQSGFGLFQIENTTVDDGDSKIMVKWRPEGSIETEAGRGPINGGKTVSDDIRGRWVQNVFHLKAQSGWNQYDASAEVWVDGRKIVDNFNLNTWPYKGGPDDGIYNVISHLYLMGWSNSGFDETSYTYIDDFRLATTPPDTIDPNTIGPLDDGTDLDVLECDNSGAAWVLCDDFEGETKKHYYDHNNVWGRFPIKSGYGLEGSEGLTSRNGFYADDPQTEPYGTWLKGAVGKTPDNELYQSFGDPTVAEKDLYYRFLVSSHTEQEEGGLFTTGPLASLSGIGAGGIPFMKAEIGNSDQSGVLQAQLYTGEFDTDGNPTGLSSTPAFELLGSKPIMIPVLDIAWHEIEMHVQLNDPGQANGSFELWIDEELELTQSGIDWAGDYSDFGINMFELFNTNNILGVPSGNAEYRAFDNLVLSGSKIGNVESGGEEPVEEEPGTPSATLAGNKSSAHEGENIDLTLGVADLVDAASVLDLTVNYDPNVLTFATVTNGESVSLADSAIESLLPNFAIASAVKETTGQIRIIMIANGEANAVTGNHNVIRLTGTVKNGASLGTSTVTLSDFITSINGEETQLLDVSGAHLSLLVADVTEPADPADLTTLDEVITIAQNSYDRAVTGSKVGQYSAEAKSALLAAIATAKSIHGQYGVSQSAVDQAATNLNTAIQTFAGEIVSLVEGATEISIRDLSIIAKYLGTSKDDANWSEIEKADVNGTGYITIQVLAAVAQMILDDWLLE